MAKRKKPAEPYRVFVSHATADKWIARMICEKIDAIPGATTFRDDRDIAGGETIPERLCDELEASNEFLVLLTPTSIDRQWVIMEIGMAFAWRMLIVPICYNTPVDRVPTIAMRKAFGLNDLDRYLGELAERVRGGSA